MTKNKLKEKQIAVLERCVLNIMQIVETKKKKNAQTLTETNISLQIIV